MSYEGEIPAEDILSINIEEEGEEEGEEEVQDIDYEKNKLKIFSLITKYKFLPKITSRKRGVFIRGSTINRPEPEPLMYNIPGNVISTYYGLIKQLGRLFHRYNPIVNKSDLEKLFNIFKKSNIVNSQFFDTFCDNLGNDRELDQNEKEFYNWLNVRYPSWKFKPLESILTQLYVKYIMFKQKYGIDYHDLHKILHTKVRRIALDMWNNYVFVEDIWPDEGERPTDFYSIDERVMMYLLDKQSRSRSGEEKIVQFSKVVERTIPNPEILSFLRWIKYRKPGWSYSWFPRFDVGRSKQVVAWCW